MADLIKSAGLQEALAGSSGPSKSMGSTSSGDPRRVKIQLIRQALRKADASDDEWDDALEALAELAKD
jgi:NaMN:DMB phosphoribosyltransferase